MSINLRTSTALSITGLAFGGIALLSSTPAEASTTASRLGDRPMVSRFEGTRASSFQGTRDSWRCCHCRWRCHEWHHDWDDD
jgi:hypothetical protein